MSDQAYVHSPKRHPVCVEMRTKIASEYNYCIRPHGKSNFCVNVLVLWMSQVSRSVTGGYGD